jgi:outer membrane protein assembly factor BamD (BamD/ComL family)
MENQTNIQSEGKIFISYSRTDSRFVLKLARRLRNSGISIWIDQLDIDPSKNWDEEIEKALKESNRIIPVLSPNSIKSKNFFDEFSYAIENKKQIIPIIIDHCDVPFRLARLQRVDFTSNYEIAYNRLSEYLKKQSNSSDHTVPLSTPRTFPKSYIVGISISIVLSLAVWLFAKNHKTPIQPSRETLESIKTIDSLDKNDTIIENEEHLLWDAVQAMNTMSAYFDYLKKYPNGKYSKEAADILTSLRNAEDLLNDQIEADDQAWNIAQSINTIEAIENYMENFPNGIHIQEAQRDIIPLQNKMKEDEQNKKDESAWQNAVRENTPNAYSTYLRNFPKGKYFNEAEERIPNPEPTITADEIVNNVSIHVKINQNDKDGDMTAYTYSLQGDSKYLDAIKEVRYVRNHDSFPEYKNNTYVSCTNRIHNFSFKSYQWGFIKTTYITIITKDNTRSEQTLLNLIYVN